MLVLVRSRKLNSHKQRHLVSFFAVFCFVFVFVCGGKYTDHRTRGYHTDAYITLTYFFLLKTRQESPPPRTKNHTQIKKCVKRETFTKSIHIARLFFNQASFRYKLHNIPFVGRSLSRTCQCPPSSSFAPRFRTSNWLVPLVSTKSYRYTTGLQTRGFTIISLTISRYGRNRANLKK